MFASTFLGIFFIPVFYVFVRRFFPYRPPAHAAEKPGTPTAAPTQSVASTH
jgi:hypothetical protein